MYGIDTGYLLIAFISMALGAITQGYIRNQYSRWSQIPLTTGETGADVARRMLVSEGASEVGITRVEGELTDFYDPRDNQLHLSDANLNGGSVASAAVACHEAGHAVQTARGYTPIKIRSALVPVVNFTSNTWMILFFVGILLRITGLTNLALILFAFSVLFHLVTLPVEIDASRRAVKYISTAGLSAEAEQGARSVLTAAALTYVAAALISVLQLLYYMGLARRNNN